MRRARYLKFSLIFVALGLMVWVFFLNPVTEKGLSVHTTMTEHSVEQNDALAGTTESISATTLTQHPRYTGRDADNRTWEVWAKGAWHGNFANSSGTVVLDQVNARADPAGDGETLTFKAEWGGYNRGSDVLKLKQNVVITGHGLTLHTEAVESNLEARTAKSDTPVHITTDNGGATLSAGGFEIEENGANIRFQGGVTGQFHLDTLDDQNAAPQQ